jgi:hypothetical protein
MWKLNRGVRVEYGFWGTFMKRFLGVASVLAFMSTAAHAALLQFDFSGNNGGGYFQVDTTNLTIDPAGYHITTGPLLGGGDDTHYYPPTPGSATFDCPSSCQAVFTTQGAGASSGLVTLTLSFANVLDNSLWNGSQAVSILETNTSGVPAHDGVAATGVFEGVGTIERTILIADPIAPSVPEPSTWALLLIGFAGIGLASYRRRFMVPV